MMPDLGKYVVPILASYGVMFLFFGVLIGLSLRRARQVRAALDAAEARRKQKRGQV